MIISYLSVFFIFTAIGDFSILPKVASDSTPFVARISVSELDPDSTYKFTIYVYGGYPSPAVISERWTSNKWKGGYAYTDFIPDESGNWQELIPLRIVKKAQEGYDYYIKFNIKKGTESVFDSTVRSSEGFQILDMSSEGGWLAGTIYSDSNFISPAEGIVVLPSISNIFGAYLTEDNKIDEGNSSIAGRFCIAMPIGTVDKIEFQDSLSNSINAYLGSSPNWEITAGETTWVDPFCIENIDFTPEHLEPGDSVIIRVILCNIGKIIKSCSVSVSYNSTEIGEVLLENIPSHSCVAPQIIWRDVPKGKYEIEVRAKTEDFSTTVSYYIQIGSGDVLINEIMYYASISGEWIEIVNQGETDINLKNWTIEDAQSKSTITQEDKWLSSNGFVVIVESTSQVLNSIYGDFQAEIFSLGSEFPDLKNDGDTIILRSENGIIQDVLRYDGSWASNSAKGISLERINLNINTNDPENWSSCVIAPGGTPGKSNSVYANYIPKITQLSVNPKIFSPKSEISFISYTLPFNQARVKLYLYDRCGRCVRKLIDGSLSGSQSRWFWEEGEITWSHIWDGRNDEGKILPMGIYIIYLEAKDQNSGKLVTPKTTVVIGK